MYLDFLVKVPTVKGKITRRKKSNVVYIEYEYDRVYDPSRKYTFPKRVTIGKLSDTDPEFMKPNQNFLKYFPDAELPESKSRTSRSSCLRVGAYFVLRKIIEECSLNDILGKYFRSRDIGLFLDLAVYSIIAENNAAQYYPDYTYDHETLLFMGLDDGVDVREKLRCIEIANAEMKCIWIMPQQREEPWVLSAQIRDDAEVLILKEITLSYYEKLAEMLLQQTGYRLEKELSLKELVNRIYARIGDEIDEECIAWFLDKAAEESQDSRKILRPGDFRQLDLNKPSAISRLQTMTGLKDMKRMALEYQAIFAEQLRNPKLRKLHNNMIFYGNPGTGKTTCGEIMAQLLLENGVSNGVFVSCLAKLL